MNHEDLKDRKENALRNRRHIFPWRSSRSLRFSFLPENLALIMKDGKIYKNTIK